MSSLLTDVVLLFIYLTGNLAYAGASDFKELQEHDFFKGESLSLKHCQAQDNFAALYQLGSQMLLHHPSGFLCLSGKKLINAQTTPVIPRSLADICWETLRSSKAPEVMTLRKEESMDQDADWSFNSLALSQPLKVEYADNCDVSRLRS